MSGATDNDKRTWPIESFDLKLSKSFASIFSKPDIIPNHVEAPSTHNSETSSCINCEKLIQENKRLMEKQEKESSNILVNAKLLQMIKDLEQRNRNLEEELRALKSTQPSRTSVRRVRSPQYSCRKCNKFHKTNWKNNF